jgi:hypothetical protein
MPTESDLMRGGCFALALHLHRRTSLQPWGLMDEEGECHHAFVADASAEYAYDARGKVLFHHVKLYKGRPSRGKVAAPLTGEELERLAGSPCVDRYSARTLDAYARRVPGLHEVIALAAKQERKTGETPTGPGGP